MSLRAVFLPVSLLTAFASASAATVLEIRNPAELKSALTKPVSSDTWKIHPGEYPGGHYLKGVERLTIEAADPENPPVFAGGSNAWQFSRTPGLTLRHLSCRGQTGNGFNLDDGGPDKGDVPGITLENLTISDIGPTGNFDGIKCSGLSGLTIKDCTIHGWGGQAIDLVGCHQVLITGCRILGKTGFSQHTGPQFKGGCDEVTLENCTFLDAGGRPIQAGGSTGLDFFRPLGAKYEARRVVIRNNKIEGGDCACAFTGVDGAEFSGNTILRPKKWFFRILTETKVEGFPPARNVLIRNNKFTWRRNELQNPTINIGPDTDPETFRFENNHWLAEDKPEATDPKLPLPQTGATFGVLKPS